MYFSLYIAEHGIQTACDWHQKGESVDDFSKEVIVGLRDWTCQLRTPPRSSVEWLPILSNFGSANLRLFIQLNRGPPDKVASLYDLWPPNKLFS